MPWRRLNARLSSFDVDARVRLVGAVDEVAAAAVPALPALPAEEAHADPVAGLPAGHAGPDRVDHAGDLVPRHHRLLAGHLDGGGVAVADTAGMHADAYLTGGWFPQFPGDLGELLRPGHLERFVRFHAANMTGRLSFVHVARITPHPG
jgi:hypothetical protein